MSCRRWLGRSLSFTLLVLTLSGSLPAAPVPVARATPPSAQEFAGAAASATPADSPPPYFYGSAAIPPGRSSTYVFSRFITLDSRIFLTVDTTAWPGTIPSLPGVQVGLVTAGRFTVTTQDQSVAPASSVPFNYVVFDPLANTSPFMVRNASLPQGQSQVRMSNSAIKPMSYILLTVDARAESASLPALRVNGQGAGFIDVATQGLTPAPRALIFNYLVVDDDACFIACRGTVAGAPVRVSHGYVSRPVGVFLTVNTSRAPGTFGALPAIKVQARGAGFFTASSLGTPPPSQVPFDYVLFFPPSRWEEHGPTGQSGNVWTVAIDPNNSAVRYVGSSFGGVWKTTNGGDTWQSAWQGQPQALIERLAMRPGAPNTLVALGLDGNVWQTTDGAATWVRFAPAPPVNNVYRSGTLAMRADGLVFVCTDGGLYYRNPALPAWFSYEPPDSLTGLAGPHKCTDIVLGSDSTAYAAFRDIGVWRIGPTTGFTWQQLKNPAQLCAFDLLRCVFIRTRPVRLALGATTMVVNDDCQVFVNSFANLNGANPTGTWTLKQRDGANKVCGSSQGGYNLSVAISPATDNHFIIGGNDGYVTRDGGATWKQLTSDADKHQTIFRDAQTVFQATDFGLAVSTDGGDTWQKARTNDRYTSGPPITEFYSLTVSRPGQFGRALVGGNSQDNGNVYLAGRTAGFYCCGGEFGLSTIAPTPTNLSSPDGQRSSRWRVYSTEGGTPTILQVSDITLPGPDYLSPATYADGTPVHQRCRLALAHGAPGQLHLHEPQWHR